MPTLTSKIGIPSPLDNESVTSDAFRAIYAAIDLGAASQVQVDRPFYLKSLTYDAGNNRLVLVFGPGRVLFGASSLVQSTIDQTLYVSTPAINTTYTVYLNPDGSFAVNTTGAFDPAKYMLWQAITGAAVTTLSKVDRRPDATLTGLIVAAQIADGTIVPSKLADSGATAGVYGAASVIPILTVDAKGRVTLASNASVSITTANILDAAITPAKLALLAVAAGHLQDGAATTPKIADAAVTPVKLSASVVGARLPRLYALL